MENEPEPEYELVTETESETESEEAEPASRVSLAWRWTIEALASFGEVPPSLVHDLIEKAVDLPEDERESPWEMVALKCLEGLFGSLDFSGENGPPQESKVVFDSSESCVGVLKLIYAETPKSALRVAGPEMAKWDIKPFIAQKRASMRCSLQQLKDSMLDGTHPYADFLMKKSGMAPVNKMDVISLSNEGGMELSTRNDSSSSDSYADFVVKESGTTPINRSNDISLNNEGGIELSSDPYADFLMKVRVATPINKMDDISLNNEGVVEFSRSQDSSSSSSDSQGKKEKGSSLLQDERRISVVCASSSSLLPSKRSAVEFTSLHEARQLLGCGDGYINAKKLKQHSAHTLYSEQEVDSLHGTAMLEDLPERIVPQEVDRRIGPEMSGQCSTSDETGFSCSIMPDCTQDGEMLEVTSVEKVKAGSELLFDPKTSNNSPAEGNLHEIITDDPEPFPAEENLHDIITDDPERGFGNDNHVNEISTMDRIGYLSKTVATSIDVGMNADEEEKDMLSDSDGFHNESIDIAMKKKELFSSQCMADHNSFPLADRSELTVCVKCNEEGGQLLSCNINDCNMVVHDKCLSSSAGMNDEGNFCCPFCLYSLAISKYLEAKKHAALAKKNVATFISTGFGHQSIVIKEVLQQQDLDPSRKDGIEDVAQICEDVDLENEDNQVTLDGEHVNEVVDHQATAVTDEQIIEQSKALHIANSDHRENEASPLKVAPDVLSGEKDGEELVDQECQGNTVGELVDEEYQGYEVAELVDQEHQGNEVAELVDQEHQGIEVAELVDQECQGNEVAKLVGQECQGNEVVESVDQECQGNEVAELVDQECQGNEVAELVDQKCRGNGIAELVDKECRGNEVVELVDQEHEGKGKSVLELGDQECQGNVAELEDGQKAVEQHDTLHEDQGPVEAVATQEGLHNQTEDNEEEPTSAINIKGEKSSDDDNDESIISRYSMRFRRKYHHSTSTSPETHQSRLKKVTWTAEEEDILREGVREFSSSVVRSPNIPWKKILEFGSGVFLQDRTPVDLKDKWRNLCRSPKKD